MYIISIFTSPNVPGHKCTSIPILSITMPTFRVFERQRLATQSNYETKYPIRKSTYRQDATCSSVGNDRRGLAIHRGGKRRSIDFVPAAWLIRAKVLPRKEPLLIKVCSNRNNHRGKVEYPWIRTSNHPDDRNSCREERKEDTRLKYNRRRTKTLCWRNTFSICIIFCGISSKRMQVDGQRVEFPAGRRSKIRPCFYVLIWKWRACYKRIYIEISTNEFSFNFVVNWID